MRVGLAARAVAQWAHLWDGQDEKTSEFQRHACPVAWRPDSFPSHPRSPPTTTPSLIHAPRASRRPPPSSPMRVTSKTTPHPCLLHSFLSRQGGKEEPQFFSKVFACLSGAMLCNATCFPSQCPSCGQSVREASDLLRTAVTCKGAPRYLPPSARPSCIACLVAHVSLQVCDCSPCTTGCTGMPPLQSLHPVLLLLLLLPLLLRRSYLHLYKR